MSNFQNKRPFLFLLHLLNRYWKFLTLFYLVVGITAAFVLLSLPQWYRSTATVVILEENTSPLSGVLSQFSSLGFGVGSGTNVETYMQYIHTKKMYDRLIAEFDLNNVYESPTIDDTYDSIFNNLSINDNENRTFSISFSYEENPVFAKEIVEFIFIELDNISLEVEKAQASNFRIYIEDYYNQTKNKLRAFEDSLITYQQKTGILDLNTQVEATLLAIAELEKQKIALQIEKSIAQKTINDSNRLQNIDNEIASIYQAISSLNSESNSSILKIDNLPEEGANYLRLMRDIEVSTQVSEFLRLQYEQALLDEQKINSDLYLLDPPKVPEKRFKPARTRTMIIVMFFAFVTSLIFIRIHYFYKQNEDDIREVFTE